MVSLRDWDNLTHVEQAFFINATEVDILPGVFGDLTEAERNLPLDELAGVLVAMVDRGWIEVRRYVRWLSPEGREGLTPGAVIPRGELPHLLTDVANWSYPDDSSWIGALTLVETEAGLAVSRLTPEEVEERNRL